MQELKKITQSIYLEQNINMSITRVYRDRDNNIKVEKFSFEEVKKDLTKFFSHDNGISNRKDNNETKRFIKHSTDS